MVGEDAQPFQLNTEPLLLYQGTLGDIREGGRSPIDGIPFRGAGEGGRAEDPDSIRLDIPDGKLKASIVLCINRGGGGKQFL